jgi:hypothetical protein
MSAKRPQQPPVNESGRPETGGGEGRREVTGRIPDDIQIDPDITEGHPGYQESGDSELTNPDSPEPPRK